MTYKNIMIPVDLEHIETLEKALGVAADLAQHYSAALTVVSVTSPAPGSVAHNPAEFADKLAKFAESQSAMRGVPFASKAVVSNDPTIDMDDALEQAAGELNADLVVMASHVPGFWDHIISSRGGYLASHSHISVLVVR